MTLSALGERNGYQHLYVEGEGKPSSNNSKFLWMDKHRFYTLTSMTSDSDQLLFTRIGASDPDFNLRRDAALMIRRKEAKDTIFVSVVEPHGSYSPVSEFAVNSNSNISELKVLYDDQYYTAVSIEDLQRSTSILILSNANPSADKEHEIEIEGTVYNWRGPYYYID
ncbi:MAG: hypothetical protein HKN43_14285 [Rhodothermales bacterium]|nr:hypothetical protein [Rhodothermales bacterium]